MNQPLSGIKVLDFSTLLPGPLCTLLLAEAGAEVIKIERPGTGDEMRVYTPRVGADSVNFALLNRGKRSIAIDLKAAGAVGRLAPLLREADILVEQFRPGVMERLGLGYDALAALNPRLVYCAITGYGSSGPRAQVAAHDLNYLAEAGMLGLAAGADGAPVVPPALIADIAGGAYPAVMNILLALRQRERTGRGCRLDVSMSDNLFTFLYWALGEGEVTGKWPGPGSSRVTGGSPRYQVYRTADGRFVAAAPLEQRFWENFCATIGLAPEHADDRRDPQATRRAVAERIAAKTADEWEHLFEGKDLCCAIVCSLEEAVRNPHFRERGLFAHKLETDAGAITAVPVPVAEAFRDPRPAGYPRLGADNGFLDGKD
ncbi:MAG: CoA transferase [Burkholderiales bacterium]|nr:CoA transferase [Burkholderiales bacterium]